MARRVIGIDPGSRKTGWGIVDARGAKMMLVASGTIVADGTGLSDRLVCIHDEIRRICSVHDPSEAAIEGIFVHRNAQSALKLGHARGAALLALRSEELEIAEYSPMVVKRALTGRGRATKEQVAEFVRLILRAPATTGFDESDALAIAVCHLQHPVALRRSAP